LQLSGAAVPGWLTSGCEEQRIVEIAGGQPLPLQEHKTRQNNPSSRVLLGHGSPAQDLLGTTPCPGFQRPNGYPVPQAGKEVNIGDREVGVGGEGEALPCYGREHPLLPDMPNSGRMGWSPTAGKVSNKDSTALSIPSWVFLLYWSHVGKWGGIYIGPLKYHFLAYGPKPHSYGGFWAPRRVASVLALTIP
jgi:hypothetical protein